jgi:hypothetical protein
VKHELGNLERELAKLKAEMRKLRGLKAAMAASDSGTSKRLAI